MKNFDIELSEKYKFLSPAKLQCFIHEGKEKKSSVLVFPGGGYYFVSGREAEPVSSRFFESGYNAFILTYSTTDRTPDVRFPMQLLQAAAAILTIRENAGEWGCTDKVVTCGFSAGGHLAGSSAVFYDLPCVLDAFKTKAENIRPSASILCYPVVSGVTTPHTGSFINLLGEGKEKDFAKYSIENGVNEKTPPIFIWHTADDTCVNVNNSILLSAQLKKNKIPFEMHIFESGPHGLSMCDETTSEGNKDLINPDVAEWFKLCVTWLKKRF